MDAALFFTAVPLAAALLKLDALTGWKLSRIPRSASDARRDPSFLLRSIGVQNATSVAFDVTGGAAAEPRKNATIVKGILSWETNCGESSSRSQLSIFIKTPSGREISLFLKALAVVFQRQQREVAFFRTFIPWLRTQVTSNVDRAVYLEPGLGALCVPKCLYAHWSRFIDRTVLIFHDVGNDWKAVPDSCGSSRNKILNILAQVVLIHGVTLHRDSTSRPSVLSFLPEQRGLDWLGGLMKLYFHRMTASQKAVWVELDRLVRDSLMCACHGDCRPGNMLFDGDDVIMTDWEAFSVTPFLWDCAYSMLCGMAAIDRRRDESFIIEAYLSMLRAAASTTSTVLLPTCDDALLLCRRLYIVVYFFGWLLQQVGGIGETQGNNQSDMKEWSLRVANALHQIFDDESEAIKVLPGLPVALLKSFFDEVIVVLEQN